MKTGPKYLSILDVVFSCHYPTSAVGDSGKEEDAFVEYNNFSNVPPK